MKKRRIKIAPSLACDDFRHFLHLMKEFEELGVDYIHYDVMDAHFVPNLTFGPELQAKINAMTDIPIDTHLMVDNPDFHIERFVQAGSDLLCVHVESTPHIDRTLNYIASLGVAPAVALNPATPLSAIEYVLDIVEMVCVMTVNPGFFGQKLVPYTIGKIAQLRRMIDRRGRHIDIEVDGNVSFENIPKMVDAGADILVAGTSSLFRKDKTIREAYRELNELLESLGCCTGTTSAPRTSAPTSQTSARQERASSGSSAKPHARSQ